MKKIQSTSAITFANGFKASGIYCGIRKNKDKKDLALIFSETKCSVASCYTTNKVKGAPIIVTKENTKNGIAQAIICNSGNANTCNADGIDVANTTCLELAKELNISATDIVIASTGVIGQPLNLKAIVNGIPSLVHNLSKEEGSSACEAILTTDLVAKQAACEVNINNTIVKIGGIAKGSGMINPNMATMLSFITTDANISSETLQDVLDKVVASSYNMVSVDGDTSTNDMVTILANGTANNSEICKNTAEYDDFLNALTYICQTLSKMIAKDGEGATKLITCNVINATSTEIARICSKSIISSSLVKAAVFGSDANWGRILCAIGYCKATIDINLVDIYFSSSKGTVAVCTNGAGILFDEDLAKEILLQDEIIINVDLKSGSHRATAWGCDLTYDYVKINGDYRT
ncbi:MAG: bifunctional glutamate N-acetyltransferase/amino-acid acetyltransferase ArgJ [Clostridia bacterium]